MSSEVPTAQRRDAAARAAGDGPPGKIERLRIRGLGKWYGSLAALRAFDLDVAGGEFISLLGPSGCGKTTALNCVAGLTEPDEGSIELDGTNLAPLPPERRGFGMVFQNYALFPHLTVARNVAFGLEMRGVQGPETVRRVAEALALVRLGDLAERYPTQLSGGQQQRVALARAVVVRPRLLLMDEPLSNLDAALRLEMRLEIRRLHQALGLTTLYVTHDQEEALSLSDRIVVMDRGTIRQVGTPEEVYGRPQSAYVAGFLGYRNLVPVTFEAAEGGRVAVVGPGRARFLATPLGRLPGRGGAAVAAIRPDDVQVLPPGAGGAAGLAARVELVEFVGNAFELSLEVGGGWHLIARTRERFSRGGDVTVHLPPERLFVFVEE